MTRLKAIDLDNLPRGEWLPKCRMYYDTEVVVMVFADGTFGVIGLDKGYYGDVSLGAMSSRDADDWISRNLYSAEEFGIVDHDEVEGIVSRKREEDMKRNEQYERETLARLKSKYGEG